MSVFWYELKANRKVSITWILACFSLILLTLAFYPIFNKEMADFLALINNLPPSMQALFGMNVDTIGSILGYYAFILIFVVLCSTIEAMLMGLNVFSKETREKTADFLLVKPKSRSKIVTSKLLAIFAWIIMSNIIYIICFYIILNMFTNAIFDVKIYFLLTGTIFFLQIFFASLGSFLGVIISRLKTPISLSLGTVFGFYLLSTFTDNKLRLLSIFKYFDSGSILLTASYELKYIIILLVLSTLLVIGNYIIYNKKDVII